MFSNTLLAQFIESTYQSKCFKIPTYETHIQKQILIFHREYVSVLNKFKLASQNNRIKIQTSEQILFYNWIFGTELIF